MERCASSAEVKIFSLLNRGSSSSGLGHRSFRAGTQVRILPSLHDDSTEAESGDDLSSTCEVRRILALISLRSKMNFIDAVVAIAKDPTMSMCGSDDERSGSHSLCVYKNNEFIGKLRWPRTTESGKIIQLAEVDEEVEKILGS